MTIKLPNFHESDEFRLLRNAMGVSEVIQLGKVDWRILENQGIDLESIEDVVSLPDRTLSYEGYRVLVYIRDQILGPNGAPTIYKYHVAECITIQKFRRNKRYDRYVVTQRKDGLFVVNYTQDGKLVEGGDEIALGVCRYCLQELDWESYLAGNKRERDKIFDKFSIKDFFEQYTSKITVLPSHDEHTSPVNIYQDQQSKLSNQYRDSVRWKCENCGLELLVPSLRQFLHLHHIDGNKSNNKSENLRALCMRCHAEQPDHAHMKRLPAYKSFLARTLPATR